MNQLLSFDEFLSQHGNSALDSQVVDEWLNCLTIINWHEAAYPLFLDAVDAIQMNRATGKKVVATGNEHGLTTVDEQWLAEQELQETYESFLAGTRVL